MVQLHRVVWEENFGPIPAGYKVYFKDGNSLNCKPENLYCCKGRGGINYKKDIKPIPDIFLKPDKAVNKSKSSIHKFNYKPQIAI